MPFRRALALITAGIDLPFGYTLSIWSSGAIATWYHGTPRIDEIFALLVGAIAGYLGLALVSAGALHEETAIRVHKGTLLNLFAVAAAAAAVVVTRFAPSPLFGFLAAGLISTVVYVVSLAAIRWLTE